MITLPLGFRWGSLRGREVCGVCADMGGEPRANFATEAVGEGCAEVGGEPHASFATGAFSSPPWGLGTCGG
eukprot:8838629-Pyramimonas_sp.AAC.1